MLNALILYVGKPEAGAAFATLAEREGSYAYLPKNLMQALGMYITYLPHVVVIDMSVDYAADAYEHLLSVDAKPMVLLTDETLRSATICALPPDATPADVLATIKSFSLPRLSSVPNGVLRYA